MTHPKPQGENARLREKAYQTVVRVRGSNDVPAFDYCVEAEYQELLAKRKPHTIRRSR